MHGVCSRRLVHREVADVGSNYKKSYFLWPGNPACVNSTGNNRIGKKQGHVSARLVWGTGREGALWLSAHGAPSDHWANDDYVDVLLMCGKCGLGSLGSWFYSKEWVWNLGIKTVLKWNVSRMTFQKFNIRYILLYDSHTYYISVAQRFAWPSSTAKVRLCYPGGQNIYKLGIYDVVNFFVKTNDGEVDGLILLFF